MPDVDGIELLRHVRGDEAWSNLPVISENPYLPVLLWQIKRLAKRFKETIGLGWFERIGVDDACTVPASILSLFAGNIVESVHGCAAVMSANERTETVFECIRGGAEDYLLKPVTKKEVQHMWQHVWRRQQQNALRVPHMCPEDVSHLIFL